MLNIFFANQGGFFFQLEEYQIPQPPDGEQEGAGMETPDEPEVNPLKLPAETSFLTSFALQTGHSSTVLDDDTSSSN